MRNPNEVTIQCCSLNGKICRNGKRDDFPVNEQTGERFICNEWVNVKGKDPQSDEIFDNWMCGRLATTKLLLEIAQMVRHNTASTDKVATEVNKHRKMFFHALNEETQGRLLEAEVVKQNGIEHKGE